MRFFLNARGYHLTEDKNIWVGGLNNENNKLKISTDLFEDGKLKYIRHSEWKDEYVSLEPNDPVSTDDVPF